MHNRNFIFFVVCLLPHFLFAQSSNSHDPFKNLLLQTTFTDEIQPGMRAGTESIPTQIIDLTQIDTTIYDGMFVKKGPIPIAGLGGYPLVIGDLNNNGKLDIVGNYKIPINSALAEIAIYEQTSPWQFNLQKLYQDSVVLPTAITDLDYDGLSELNFRKQPEQAISNYEALSATTYPEAVQFIHRMWPGGGGATSHEVFLHLDQDTLLDVIYRGDDSTCMQTFVAEYSPEDQNFVRVFGHCLISQATEDYSVFDFDQDGYLEFAAGNNSGEMYVIENCGDNCYQVTFGDTLFGVNANMSAATNDIDQNGKHEFFIACDSWNDGVNGLRIYWFEASSNNVYERVRSLFLPFISGFGVSTMNNVDIDQDGYDELMITLETDLYFFLKWQNNQFEVFYLDWWEGSNQRLDIVTPYDLNADLKPDLIVSISDLQTEPNLRSYVFQQEIVSGLNTPEETLPEQFYLHSNYPNPFNPMTTIDLTLNRPGFVDLTIFDMSGKKVKTLANKRLSIGKHSFHWNSRNEENNPVSSGIYYYKIKSNGATQTRKMVLIR